MAKSGSKSVAVTAWDTLKFSWTQVSQSITGNSSTVDWVLSLVSGSAGRIDSSASKDWSVTVNGVKYSGTNRVGIANNSTLVLASGTTTIDHNNDGTKTFSYSFSQKFGITFSGETIGTISGSGTGELDRILRATTPSVNVSQADMGDTITIYTPRTSSAYTHDLSYSFGDLDWQKIASDVDTYVYWKVPMDLANYVPNKINGTLKIRCHTKQGNTIIGTKIINMQVRVPDSVVPTIDSLTILEASDGISAQFNALVQNKSTAAVTINASGAYGSSIISYSTVFEGKVYTGREWTSDVIKKSGTIEMVTTVIDSRGRITKKTSTIDVVVYTTPKILNFEVWRCDASGNPKSDGNYVRIDYKYEAPSVNNGNTVQARVEWKSSSDTTYKSTALYTDSNLTSEVSAVVSSVSFAADKQYDIRLTVRDWFGASAAYNDLLPSDDVIMDIKADGTGISFLEFCNSPGVTIRGGIPRTPIAILTGADLDTITEPGFYRIARQNSTAAISNMPGSQVGPASLIVLSEGDGTVLRQIYKRHAKNDGKIWERTYSDGSWDDWIMVYAGSGNILWSGTNKMVDVTITLSEAITKQPNGVVLVFSQHTDPYFLHSFFIPKHVVSAHPGMSHQFLLSSDGVFSVMGSKYLLINDTTITGRTNNGSSGTASGITYNNAYFALRYVIGV